MKLTFETLRKANIARQEYWGGSSDWDLYDWLVALGGEVGEALDEIKKVRRRDFTLDENRENIAKELADVITYNDILMYKNSTKPVTIILKEVRPSGNPTNLLSCILFQHTGNTLVHIMEEYPAAVHDDCIMTIRLTQQLAHKLDIDLMQAVEDKFNEVSRRVGAPVFIVDNEISNRIGVHIVSRTQWKIGEIVRYGEVVSALMVIDDIHENGRCYGRQCFGGPCGASVDQLTKASVQDIEFWNEKHPSTVDGE